MGDTADYEHGQPKPVSNDGASMHDLVTADIQERKQYGLDKYESLLQTNNGRNFMQDLYEELQDAIVYIRGALEEQRIVIAFIKHLLSGYAAMHDQIFPEHTDQVIITAANMPGWLVQVHKEVLGDRFEYIESI